VIEKLVTAVNQFRNKQEKVIVNERLGNPRKFFQFYLKDINLEKFDFKNINIWEEKDRNALYVDVLPFEPSPAEPLYTQEGDFPEKLTLLYKDEDANLKQNVFIYRYED
jgi:hypothetical protein